MADIKNNRLSIAFRSFQDRRRLGLFIYLTVGFPSLTATVDLCTALAEAGVDAIELGIPFSDPLADGPVIQAASEDALRAGVNMEICLRIGEKIRKSLPQMPLIFMGYYNPILQYGPQNFANASIQAGIDATIIPDLSLEESAEFDEASRKVGLGIVPLLSPLTTTDRISQLAARGAVFLYATSRLGVTGVQGSPSLGAIDLVHRARVTTTCPIAVGFGISRREHLQSLQGYADAAIVGSAFVSAIGTATEPVRAAKEFVTSLLPPVI